MQFLKSLHKKNFADEIVLLRVDLNVENAQDSWRRDAIIPTLKWLSAHNARVLMLSHRGRPAPINGADAANIRHTDSLRVNVPYLSRLSGAPVHFISHFRFDEIREMLCEAAPGSMFLLENIRLCAGEEKNDARFAKTLASLGTMYVNDAFAVSHRKHASIVAIARYLPSYAGLLFERERAALQNLMRRARRPFVVIIGGVKVADKMGVLKYFLRKADMFLFGGGIANTILKATGTDIGDSVYDKRFLPFGRALARNKKVEVLRDWLWDNNKILDIGPLTIEDFRMHIRHAKTVLWNGPLGQLEDVRYANGSIAIARAIAGSKAFSVVGGGETTQLVRSLGVAHRISFLSTGGGAMLEFLAGKKLPGIEALG